MNDHTAGGRELLMTHMTLEMLSFLMLYQYLLVLELALAVKTPHLERFLLLLAHRYYPRKVTLCSTSCCDDQTAVCAAISIPVLGGAIRCS